MKVTEAVMREIRDELIQRVDRYQYLFDALREIVRNEPVDAPQVYSDAANALYEEIKKYSIIVAGDIYQ